MAEFWWKVLCGFARETKRKRRREKKDGREERGTNFFYIICYYNLYYFNEVHVKIETEMLGSCKMRW